MISNPMTKISIRFYNDREVRAAWDKKNFKVPKSKFQSAWHFEMIPSKTTTREVHSRVVLLSFTFEVASLAS